MLYAVIIALWICILLPMWLRRHDEAMESRSVDRFSSAMRTLSGRGTPDRREIVMPARANEPVHADGHARAVAEGRAVLAARRRRSLSLLLGLTLFVAGGALLGWLPRWVPALPALLAVAFLVHLRRETRAQDTRDRRRRTQQVASENRRRRTAAVPARRDVTAEVERLLPAYEEPAYEEPVGVEPVLARVDDGFYDAEQERAWDPVPVPLPTYVTAPKAPRSVRVIDLTKPGLWTSGHLTPEEAAALDVEGYAVEVVDAEGAAVRHEPFDGAGIVTGEVVIERRRAVND